MKLKIYILILFLSVTLWKCNPTKKINVTISELNFLDSTQNNIDTLKLESKLSLSFKVTNQDTVQYENMTMKLFSKNADTIPDTDFQESVILPLIKNGEKIFTYEIDADFIRVGKINFVAELYCDTSLISSIHRSLFVIIPNKSDSMMKDTVHSKLLSNTIIATNPEFYSYQSNNVDYNIPIYFTIRIQHKGNLVENNLIVNFSSTDNEVKILNESKRNIAVLLPESNAYVLDDCCFIINKGRNKKDVGISVTLVKENNSEPCFSETYGLKIGSAIEKRKTK